MNKLAIEKYTETEIQNGRTHQEIFNKIVSESNFNIHDVAEVVRKVPTLEKRKRYALPNNVLVGMICLTIISKLVIGFSFLLGEFAAGSLLTIVPLIISSLLLLGIYNFRRNAHLATGLLMLLSSVNVCARVISKFDIVTLLDALCSIFACALAFYLNAKLVSDYVLNRELQKADPQQRENSITFTD